MTDRRRSQAAGAVSRVVAATVLAVALSSPARAQAPTPEPAAQVGTGLRPEVLAEQERRCRTLSRRGIGLTSTGLGLAALAAGLFFIPNDMGGIISGGVLAGVGSLLYLAGVPTWITGAVRRSLARAGNPLELRRRWSRAGRITFLSGLAVAAMGAITLGVGASGVSDDHGESLFISGVSLLPLGVVISLFVGVPMWVEPTGRSGSRPRRRLPGPSRPTPTYGIPSATAGRFAASDPRCPRPSW